MHRFLVIVFWVILGDYGAIAQGFQQLTGRVVDRKTGKPVAFAYISVAGKAWGTLANEEGRFLLKYPKIDARKDGIVSAPNFQNAVVALQGLKPVDSVTVQLEPAIPLAIRSQIDARLLVVSALKAIPANFQPTPTVLTGFYRETLATDTACWNLREAVLKVEKLPIAKTELPEKVKLVKGRQLIHEPFPKVLEGYAFPNGTAIVTRSMDLGPPDYLDGNNLNEYEFRLDSVLTGFDNRPAYRLAFKPVAGRRVRAARTGEILIDTASRAIVRIAYELTPEAADALRNTNLKPVFDQVRGRSKKEIRRLSAHSQYRQFNGIWYLQDSRLVLDTRFSGPKSAPVLASIRLHFVTNEYARSNGQAVKETERLLTTEKLPRQTGRYDERYWGQFNTVLPTEAEQFPEK